MDRSVVVVLDVQAERMRFGRAYKRFRFIGCHFRKRHDVLVALCAMPALFGAGHRVPIFGARFSDGEMNWPHGETLSYFCAADARLVIEVVSISFFITTRALRASQSARNNVRTRKSRVAVRDTICLCFRHGLNHESVRRPRLYSSNAYSHNITSERNHNKPRTFRAKPRGG
jgi:hypothetical protein